MPSNPTSPLETQPLREVYSVSRLNREARLLLEGGFPPLWVEGELSNVSRPSSGHLYFTLKDEAAQVRCAMFRTRNALLAFDPENGIQVLARARVSLYEGRGDYQLIVEHLEEAGDGALRRAFEQLKQRLAAAGLFDAAHKKPVPRFARRIGVITSPTGAALRDILSVLRRRFPALPVLLYPVQVQGENAAPEIAAALRLASQRRDCDVLILARGGGSLEDLWAFNEEIVARAIYDCEIPVVTGIGHEIDFTTADFVADHRAPTPSAAAELVSPNQDEWLDTLQRHAGRLQLHLRQRMDRKRQDLLWLTKRLQQLHPGQRLRQQAQRLDELEQRLKNAERAGLRHATARLTEICAHLLRYSPAPRLRQWQAQTDYLAQRLHNAWHRGQERYCERLASLSRALDTVSPLATLGRGYAIVTRLPDRGLLRDAADVAPGARVEARLARGRLLCLVHEVKKK